MIRELLLQLQWRADGGSDDLSQQILMPSRCHPKGFIFLCPLTITIMTTIIITFISFISGNAFFLPLWDLRKWKLAIASSFCLLLCISCCDKTALYKYSAGKSHRTTFYLQIKRKNTIRIAIFAQNWSLFLGPKSTI